MNKIISNLLPKKYNQTKNMKNDLLKNNLDNISSDIDLFGNEHKRLSMSDRIGFLPISIWKPDWEVTKQLKEIVGDKADTRDLVGKKNITYGEKYTTSIFNPHLAQMILSAYCPSNAKIYDAFAGGGTRGFIASAMGHSYTGIEIRDEECDRIMAQQSEIRVPFALQCADSRFYDIDEGLYDFSYSCPPYYDLEVYSKVDGDMSNASSYEEFLAMLKQSLEVTYKGLKPGSLCVWVVGNFRRNDGSLRHFNGDVVRLGQEIGFNLWDELVFWGASDAAFQRSGQFVANRKSVRVHEYLVVFKKP